MPGEFHGQRSLVSYSSWCGKELEITELITHTHTHTHTHAHTRKKKKLSRVPWAERRSNQSILKEINPEYSLDGLMPKLKLQYFGHLMQRTDSLEKTKKLGRIEGKRRRGSSG